MAQQVADVYVASRTLTLAADNAAWRVGRGLPAADDLAVAAYWVCAEGLPALHTCQHLHGGMGVDVTYPLHRYFSRITDLTHALGGPRLALDAVRVEQEAGRNLELTGEQRALKAELRAYFAGLASPEEHREMARDRHGPTYQRTIKQMGTDGWMGVGWPREYGGHGLGEVEQTIFANEAAARRRAPARGHPADRRADPHPLRHPRAEGAVPPAHPRRRRALRDRLQRAGRRHRPRLAAHHGAARGRRRRRAVLPGQRAEAVDHRRPPGRLPVARRPHRPRRPEARGASRS